MKNKELFQQISGLLAGSIVGGVISLWIESLKQYFNDLTVLLFLAGVFLGLFSFDSFTWILKKWNYLIRKNRNIDNKLVRFYRKLPGVKGILHPRVGIINDIEWKGSSFSWAIVKPKEWKESFDLIQTERNKKKVKADLISVTDNWDCIYSYLKSL
jgi:hypothetical protein